MCVAVIFFVGHVISLYWLLNVLFVMTAIMISVMFMYFAVFIVRFVAVDFDLVHI